MDASGSPQGTPSAPPRKTRPWPAVLGMTLVLLTGVSGWALGPFLLFAAWRVLGEAMLREPESYWWLYAIAAALMLWSVMFSVWMRNERERRTPQQRAEIAADLEQERERTGKEMEERELRRRKGWKIKLFAILCAAAFVALAAWFR